MRFGLVGCGPIGQGRHLPAFAAYKGIEVAAVCDLDKAKADKTAAQYKVKAYYSLDEMLAKEKLDIIDVATNERVRPAPLIQCLETGAHVFTEKPLVGKRGQMNLQGDDLPEAKRIIDAWRKRKQCFGINFNYRTLEHTNLLKKSIEDGTMGEPVMMNGVTHFHCWSHVMDLMRWFNGDVVELSCVYSGPAENPDRVAWFKFKNGSIGSLVGTARMTPPGKDMYSMEMEYIGTKAKARLTGLCAKLVLHPIGKNPQVLWDVPYDDMMVRFGQAFERTIRAYCDAVFAGKQPPVTGLDGFREAELDCGMHISATTGKPYKVELY
ncbi:MAG: Gfo/Idh/MocA family oxidoreductase [Planctomycetota bacterium]